MDRRSTRNNNSVEIKSKHIDYAKGDNIGILNHLIQF
jgi:hypothetical protein